MSFNFWIFDNTRHKNRQFINIQQIENISWKWMKFQLNHDYFLFADIYRKPNFDRILTNSTH